MVNLSHDAGKSIECTWSALLDLLRDELQEYGGLIGLLNAQQQSILNRKADSLLEINQSVQSQMEASQILQKRRQGFVEALAKNFGKPYHSKLSELLEYVPDVTQPMFESIIDEINNLITKVRRKVEQNQRLLTRLCDVTDQVLQATSPASHSKTYSATGKVGRLSNSGSSLNHRV